MSEIEAFRVGATLAQGRVLDGSGSPVAGVTVLARAWPDPNSLKAMDVGDSFPLRTVSSSSTDTSGNYALALSPEELTSLLQGASTLNMEFVAVVGENPPSRFATLTKDGTLTSGETGVPNKSFTTTVRRSNATRESGIPLDFMATATNLDEASPAAMAPPKGWNCTLTSNLGPRDVIVGQTYSTVSGGHTRQFTYTAGASTTISVAVSSSGTYGSFSKSGTVAATSTVSIGFPTHSDIAGRSMKTQFTFGKFRYYEVTTSTPRYYYIVYPTGFAGGASIGNISTPTATYCVAYVAGSTFEKKTTTVITWSNGASLNSVIGIDLSTRTGYSSEAKLHYTFSSAKRLCGQTGYPGNQPYTIVVKA